MNLKIDTDALLKQIADETKTEFKGLLEKLKEDQKELFLNVVNEIQKESIAYSFGPESERELHSENLRSLRNALTAIEGIVAIRAYRSAINVVGRVIVAIARATLAAAIAL